MNRYICNLSRILSIFLVLTAASPVIPKQMKNHGAEKIPILMYHQISKTKNGPQKFRGQLQKLYDSGFATITAKQLIENDFPKDKKPVLITFDDGFKDNFEIINGKISSNSAVGILNDFYDKHTDFGKHAIFFISFDKTPFGQKEYIKYKLEYLLNNSMEIGNHTLHHADLRKASKDKIDQELGGAMQQFELFLGRKSIDVVTCALPYNSAPSNKESFRELKSFEFAGKRYRNLAVFYKGGDYYRVGQNKYNIARFSMDRISIDQVISGIN